MDITDTKEHGVYFTAFLGAGVVLPFVIWYLFFRNGFVSPRGKIVFITGCDSGFGLALAKKLSALDYHVIAGCLSRTSDGAKELEPLTNVDVIKCDVTSDEDVEEARKFVQKLVSDSSLVLWAIVNNAGVMYVNYVEWQPLSYFKRQYDVNALGPVRILKALLPFVRRSRGRVVNVSSIAGSVSAPSNAAYAMSKFAVRALSDALRLELAPFGVKVATIQPLRYNTYICEEKQINDEIERQWRETDPAVQRDYGATFRDAFHERFGKALLKSQNIDEVIDSMAHAVTSKKPKTTYTGHWTTTACIWFMAHVFPVGIRDWFMNQLSCPSEVPAMCDREVWKL